MKKESNDIYAELARIYHHLNVHLFDGELTGCVFTLHSRATVSFFERQRYENQDGRISHGIAVNLRYAQRIPVMEFIQFLAHDMCHQWEYQTWIYQGAKEPGRRGYHSTRWAQKMESLGLMSTSTGHPGGCKTGEKVGQYPIVDGPFLRAFATLDSPALQLGLSEKGTDREHLITSFPRLGVEKKEKIDLSLTSSLFRPPVRGRSIYMCSCFPRPARIWAKPGLRIRCCDCNQPFVNMVQQAYRESP